MRRKRRRNDFVGCSLTSHRGRLRLEWRAADPVDQPRTRTWLTGDDDTPENREKWEPVRRLVGALRAAGEDPMPHLNAHHPRETPASAKPDEVTLTVRGFYGEWIQTQTGAVRPALFDDYRKHFGTYILRDPIFPDLALAEVRPMDVQLLQARLRAHVSRRSGEPLKEKSVHCIINGSLRAMFRDAMVQDLLLRDPFVGLRWKRLDPPPAAPLAPEEREKVAEWFAGRTFQRKLTWRQHPAFLGFVFFLRWHGARPSEAAGLSWEDVDLRQGIAYVRASYHHGSLGEPRTRTARGASSCIPKCSLSYATSGRFGPSLANRSSRTSTAGASGMRPSGVSGLGAFSTAASGIGGSTR